MQLRLTIHEGIRQELQFCPDDNRSAGKLVYKSDSIGMVSGRIMCNSGYYLTAEHRRPFCWYMQYARLR